MLASRYQTPIAFAEPALGFPTDVLDDLGLFFQAQLEMSADFRGIALGPGAFDQDASGMGVAAYRRIRNIVLRKEACQGLLPA